MSHQINEIINKIKEAIVNHGIDWLITSIVAFVSVRFATKRYYNTVRSRNVRPYMEQGLKKILGKKIIPANAKAILVENKGFAVFRWRKYECSHPVSRIRKTIQTVGGNENSTSEARARYWGVLGLAYLLRSILVYDFRQHKLLTYGVGITELQVIQKQDKLKNVKYYYSGDIKGKPCELYLSNELTDRKIMIAIPLIYKQKIVGGVTFDVDCEIDEQADKNEEKKYLIGNNRKVVIDLCKSLNDLSSNIVNAYFREQ